MRYLVTYDLNRPGQNYQPLYDTLKGWGAQRVLLSTWVLSGEGLSVTRMRDALRAYIDQNDRLLVTEMGTWAGWNTMVDINKI